MLRKEAVARGQAGLAASRWAPIRAVEQRIGAGEVRAGTEPRPSRLNAVFYELRGNRHEVVDACEDERTSNGQEATLGS